MINIRFTDIRQVKGVALLKLLTNGCNKYVSINANTNGPSNDWNRANKAAMMATIVSPTTSFVVAPQDGEAVEEAGGSGMVIYISQAQNKSPVMDNKLAQRLPLSRRPWTTIR